ncbi:MAG: hypothetical protein KDD61_17725, partial [Bdellovibrionales bacterium]|nr:hypothetical protein [Bdellovibrionales bacterium]
MVKFLISCIVILTSCFCSLGASAFLLEGRVEKRLSIPHIFHNGKMYPMYSKNYNIQVDLNELKSGDFMAGTGEFNKDKTALYVESINSVGLVDLLGIWHTSKWDVFEFLDFSRLNLYVSKVQLFNQEPSLFGFQTVRYSVSPGFSPNNWSILLVDPMG